MARTKVTGRRCTNHYRPESRQQQQQKLQKRQRLMQQLPNIITAFKLSLPYYIEQDDFFNNMLLGVSRRVRVAILETMSPNNICFKQLRILLHFFCDEGLVLTPFADYLPREQIVEKCTVADHVKAQMDEWVHVGILILQQERLELQRRELRRQHEMEDTSHEEGGENNDAAADDDQEEDDDSPIQVTDFRVARELLKENGLWLRHVDPSLRLNLDLVYVAVRQNGLALKYAPDILRAHRNLVLASLCQNPDAFKYVDEALRVDPSFVRLLRNVLPQHFSHLVDTTLEAVKPAEPAAPQKTLPLAPRTSLFYHGMTELDLQLFLEHALESITLDHVRNTLSALVRPMRFCSTTAALKSGIQSRLQDLIHFWNCLQKTAGLLRQRHLIELILLSGIFYLVQVYKQRVLEKCTSPVWYSILYQSNLDVFVRFRLLDWHTEELIVSRKVNFIVHQPKHTEHIISAAIGVTRDSNLPSYLQDFQDHPFSTIFPHPKEALSVCKIDDFFLRCLLTFSVCTQELHLIDLPLLQPLTQLLSFEQQHHVLQVNDRLYQQMDVPSPEQESYSSGCFRRVSSFVPLEKQNIRGPVHSFPSLRRILLQQNGNITFPPTQRPFMQMEDEFARLLMKKQKELQKLTQEASFLSWIDPGDVVNPHEQKEHTICCIKGCENIADLPSQHTIHYDELCSSYDLKDEFLGDPMRERLVCRAHQQLDEKSFGYGAAGMLSSAGSTDTFHGLHDQESIDAALSELVLRNATKKIPSMRKNLMHSAQVSSHLRGEDRLLSLMDQIGQYERTHSEAREQSSQPTTGTKNEDGILKILIDYITQNNEAFCDEIRYIISLQWYSVKQVIDMCTVIIQLMREDEALEAGNGGNKSGGFEYQSSVVQQIEAVIDLNGHLLPNRLLNYITHHACLLYPQHKAFLVNIADSSLPILRDYFTFRYFILLNIIRYKEQPLLVHKPHILMQMVSHREMDSEMEAIIDKYMYGEGGSEAMLRQESETGQAQENVGENDVGTANAT